MKCFFFNMNVPQTAVMLYLRIIIDQYSTF